MLALLCLNNVSGILLYTGVKLHTNTFFNYFSTAANSNNPLVRVIHFPNTTIINVLLFQCGDCLYTPEPDVTYIDRRQILTYKDGPRIERVNTSLIEYYYMDSVQCLSVSSINLRHRLFASFINLWHRSSVSWVNLGSFIGSAHKFINLYDIHLWHRLPYLYSREFMTLLTFVLCQLMTSLTDILYKCMSSFIYILYQSMTSFIRILHDFMGLFTSVPYHFMTSSTCILHQFTTYFNRILHPFMALFTFNNFKPEFTIVIFIHYKPRIAVAAMTWSGWQIKKKLLLFSKQFHENFGFKTTRFVGIKSSRYAKWCFNPFTTEARFYVLNAIAFSI